MNQGGELIVELNYKTDLQNTYPSYIRSTEHKNRVLITEQQQQKQAEKTTSLEKKDNKLS
jgi:hypothetical protein